METAALNAFEEAAPIGTRSQDRSLPRVLVVEDNDDARETFAMVLEEIPVEVHCSENAEDALGKLAEIRFDTVVSDFRMPGTNGLELLRQVKKTSPLTEFVLLTGFANVRDAVTAMKEGACDYLQKPVHNDELQAIVQRAIDRAKMRREIEDLRRRVRERGSISSIVTCSESMHVMLQVVQDVSRTDATVLITGESGTGKELVALAVVENSLRRDAPFHTVNCAALTQSLVESELFGHVRGAFTGAVSDRLGILGEADGGTVFLDEVGELPIETQAKFLRFLETGEMQRVGASQSKIVDVRVVAATNCNLSEVVKDGRFREDLYFRLNVISIEIPPLRARPEDILLLADHFIGEMNSRYGCSVEGLSRTAREFFEGYRWPGNVRELRNWIERMVIIKGSGVLELDDLHGGNRDIFEPNPTPAFTWPNWTLDRLNLEYIQHVLKECRGNRTAAADKLGISRVTLWRRLKEMGLE